MSDTLVNAIWDLRELAFEGFSRGWDGIDRRDKRAEIDRVVESIKGGLDAATSETARLRAEVERLKSNYDHDIGVMQMRVDVERAELDSLRTKLAAAERERDEWRDTCQAISDLFDPLHHEALPHSALMVARAAKDAHRSVRDDRDRLQSQLDHLVSQAGEDSCADLADKRNRAIADRDRLAAELQAAREESERMRAVYEAAVRWHAEMDWSSSRCHGEVFTCELSLHAAIDAALAAKENG